MSPIISAYNWCLTNYHFCNYHEYVCSNNLLSFDIFKMNKNSNSIFIIRNKVDYFALLHFFGSKSNEWAQSANPRCCSHIEASSFGFVRVRLLRLNPVLSTQTHDYTIDNTRNIFVLVEIELYFPFHAGAVAREANNQNGTHYREEKERSAETRFCPGYRIFTTFAQSLFTESIAAFESNLAYFPVFS